MFLLRSRNVPFNLTVIWWHTGRYKLATILNKDLSRLKTVDIEWRAALTRWNIELANIPYLEVFRLKILDLNDPPGFVRVHLANAPRLRHLFLAEQVTVCYGGQLAFENLTNMSLLGVLEFEAPEIGPRYLSWRDCLLPMQASPSLEASLFCKPVCRPLRPC